MAALLMIRSVHRVLAELCLEDKKEDYRIIQCCICTPIVQSYAHTYEQHTYEQFLGTAD